MARLNKDEITELLPHREPMLLIDELYDIKKLSSATAVVNVKRDSFFVQGHFPDNPVMPGVLIVESLAQTAAVLVAKTLNSIDSNMLVYFMSMNNTKFRKLVRPGDSLNLLVSVTQSRRNIWKFHGDAFVFDELVAEADFTAMMVEPDLKNVKP